MLVDGFDRDLAPNIDSYLFGGHSQSNDPLIDQLVKSQVYVYERDNTPIGFSWRARQCYPVAYVKSRLPRRPKRRELVTNCCYMYLGLMSQHIGELVPIMNVIIRFLRDCTLE